MRRVLEPVLVLVVLALLCVPATPSQVRTSKSGLAASAKTAPVCPLPQPRRIIVGLRVVGYQPPAIGFDSREAARAVHADTPGPPVQRPRKCPPPRAASSTDPDAPAALLVDAFA